MKKILFLCTFLFWSFASDASVSINGTRVVFNQKDLDKIVKITNKGKSPALTHSWIECEDSACDNENIPFVITPPINRIEANSAQSLRIVQTVIELPMNRETLFYLNVLDVPPKPKNGDTLEPGLLQMAFKTRIKFFYRPAGLPIKVTEAVTHIGFDYIGKSGNKIDVKINNPTPYHISFSKLNLKFKGEVVARQSIGGMVKPFDEISVSFIGTENMKGTEYEIELFNVTDAGGEQKVNYTLPAE